MKFVTYFLLFLVFSTLSVVGATEKNVEDSSFMDKTLSNITDDSLWYITSFGVSASGLSRDIKGADNLVDSSVDNILQGSVNIVLFPEKYAFTLGLTKNITNNVKSNLYNPNNYDDDILYFNFSAIPIYFDDIGGIGIFYNSTEQNSYYTNHTGAPLGPYKYKNKTQFEFAFPVQAGTEVDNYIKNGQSYQTKEKASYLGIKYLFPKNEYLPEGFNVFYSEMDRETVYYAQINTSTVPQHKIIHLDEKGIMYGIGLQRPIHDLPLDELSIDLVQISKGKFDGFPDIKLSEYTIGATYVSDYWYAKAILLYYVAEEFYSNEGVLELFVPKHSDLHFSFHIGYAF